MSSICTQYFILSNGVLLNSKLRMVVNLFSVLSVHMHIDLLCLRKLFFEIELMKNKLLRIFLHVSSIFLENSWTKVRVLAFFFMNLGQNVY